MPRSLGLRYGWSNLATARGCRFERQLSYEYYAIAPNELSADTITVNFTGTTCSVLNAFSIVGANTSSPFDTNASLPGTSNGSTVSATTSNANDLIFAAYNSWGTATPSAGSGWTTISGPSGDYYLSEYQTVSATQSGLAATLSSGGIRYRRNHRCCRSGAPRLDRPDSVVDRGIALERRPRCRQDCHADART